MESYESIQALARRADAELSPLGIAIGVQGVNFTIVSETSHRKSV